MVQDIAVQKHDCARCGECCLISSPTLQAQDLFLIENNTIKKEYLYTIRKGELVRDNINNTLEITPIELIKVKDRDNGKGGCFFYNDQEKACEIYEQKPVQCVALNCRDTGEFLKIYNDPKLERKDIIKNGTILRFIEEHEKRCNYFTLQNYVQQIEQEGEKAVERILDIIKFDYRLRPFIADKLDLNPRNIDFFFGRPLILTITMFGFKVIRQNDGSFFLTMIE